MSQFIHCDLCNHPPAMDNVYTMFACDNDHGLQMHCEGCDTSNCRVAREHYETQRYAEDFDELIDRNLQFNFEDIADHYLIIVDNIRSDTYEQIFDNGPSFLPQEYYTLQNITVN